MKKVDLATALRVIKHEFLSHLVVDIKGDIRAIEPLKAWPTAEEVIALGKKHRGCAAKFIERQEMTEVQLQKEIDGLVEALALGKEGKLKPGANLVDKQGHVEWAQDAARRRLKQQAKDGHE